MKIKYFFPLVIFLVPTLIGAFLIWPEGARQALPIIGFLVMLISSVGTYFTGIKLVLEDARKEALRG